MEADAGRSATTRKSAPRPDPAAAAATAAAAAAARDEEEEAEARQVDDAHEGSPTSPAAGAASPKRTKRRSAKKAAAAAESADLAAMAEATSLAAAEAAAAPQVTEQSPACASPKRRANGLRRLQGPGRPDNKAAVAKEEAPSVSVEPTRGKVSTAGVSSGGQQTAVKTESKGKATSSNATTDEAVGTCGMHPELFKLMKANASTVDRGAAWRQKQKDDMLKVVRADKSVFLKQLSAARTSISKELKNSAPPATTTPTKTATSPQSLLLPPDFREPLGVISVEQLAKFGAGKRGDRMLVSVYGTVFDVSEQAAKYCKGGEHSRYTGRDMTWALVTGQPSDCNRFFDIFKSEPAIWELNLECFCRTIVSHEQEYGAPVARLDVFEEEHKLLRPPAQATDCVVQ
jgi:predicted heme/steroid binding protein